MKNLFLLTSLFAFTLILQSQELKIPLDTSIETNHSVTIGKENINYKATAGMQPLWNKEGKVIATLSYSYYKRTNGKEVAERPILFSFNGGPGSASVWMHLAYTGPKVLNIDNEGYPVQPYGL